MNHGVVRHGGGFVICLLNSVNRARGVGWIWRDLD